MRLPFAAIACLCLALLAQTTFAQPKKTKAAAEEADAEAAQQRTVAISLVTSLADEARSFKDMTRRARVQARAADVLWDTDRERARELFRRAWEAAETVDAEAAKKRAEEMKRLESEGGPVVVRGGPDLRSEVLRLVAKRDRKLGEEFLKALDEAAEKERNEVAADQRRRDPSTRLGASQRLQLARRLVEDGDVERALQFATPALNAVNTDTIFFLSALREKNAQAADSAYTALMARAANDPTSDANTVSGLSSYLFTPFLYVTFEPGGGAKQSRQRGPTPPPDVGWAQFRALGACALDLCAVADGLFDGYVDFGDESHGVWDYLGGVLICDEVGIEVVDAFDRPLVHFDVAARRTPVAGVSPKLTESLLAARRRTSV